MVPSAGFARGRAGLGLIRRRRERHQVLLVGPARDLRLIQDDAGLARRGVTARPAAIDRRRRRRLGFGRGGGLGRGRRLGGGAVCGKAFSPGVMARLMASTMAAPRFAERNDIGIPFFMACPMAFARGTPSDISGIARKIACPGRDTRRRSRRAVSAITGAGRERGNSPVSQWHFTCCRKCHASTRSPWHGDRSPDGRSSGRPRANGRAAAGRNHGHLRPVARVSRQGQERRSTGLGLSQGR